MKFTLVAVLATLALLGNTMAEDDLAKKLLDSLENVVDAPCLDEMKPIIEGLATTYENSAKEGKKLDVFSLFKNAKNFSFKTIKNCFFKAMLALKKSAKSLGVKFG